MNIRKYEVLSRIHDLGVVGIIRTPDTAGGIASAEAVFQGGITVLEVSTTFPGALDIMRSTAASHKSSGLILGAGTVADSETAKLCIDAGAEFIVSHCFSEEVARLCNRYGVAYMPGVGTVTEIVRAMEWGADVVKAFPGEVLGPKFIKAVHGPLPNAQIMPIGGVSPNNLEDWFLAGAFAVGLGSALVKPEGREGDYPAIRQTAEEIVSRIARIRTHV
ncbi:KHG/KDPG aldolase [bioreactor metagenome]|jgi:2-dehydro-3-deoxyphosphogluconate aldolase/(4S)-4-hydroxy-2-oxoglutarate aldolase|uniref:KHG/KDPG aldolase n=1 Tax=bioreactor metagenome TaxID=1076179 RepID=A0A644W9C9_9ZZZZ|nr:bifunctional 4-hydroxy-2-oxoglutarate aldolase/2-dehydro-3-deoxy-phosphogluconate aldolase [Aminivibrio sp.]MEA4952618.1 bifunctional 4-hydroxy-2-oxoglutarate aldolase/2-dehydro-3-deoxy-phosphogluconate aldolase [Aminivibrio sp.]NCB14987.1 bifunctional 4-hydroxy-2-oxoglutarate aldolase/2-dehydro-3-deoxy-phosphogluconate aldolase [Synergistales bacterium]HPF85770.1 bifunctional 4-hydroxy-2-oxoglutarate aldolase/2-dehydro-3-deoxy-phosphogluconate aldolase [Aminivibrio sp.]HRX26226.1 bifunction